MTIYNTASDPQAPMPQDMATAGNSTGASANFHVPASAFPFSASTSSSRSNQSSSSGLNWDSPFMRDLYPSLMNSATSLQGNVDRMGDTLQGQYSNLMRQGMGPNAFQGTLNSLSGRNMLNSKVASDTMGAAAHGVAQDIGNRQFDANLAQQQAQMQVPQILGNLASLGQESHSHGSSSGSSNSYQANPLAPYDLMSQNLRFQASAG
jgi:hypothetical protein